MTYIIFFIIICGVALLTTGRRKKHQKSSWVKDRFQDSRISAQPYKKQNKEKYL